jgi:hypothetical protein
MTGTNTTKLKHLSTENLREMLVMIQSKYPDPAVTVQGLSTEQDRLKLAFMAGAASVGEDISAELARRAKEIPHVL